MKKYLLLCATITSSLLLGIYIAYILSWDVAMDDFHDYKASLQYIFINFFLSSRKVEIISLLFIYYFVNFGIAKLQKKFFTNSTYKYLAINFIITIILIFFVL
jgi:hypothetical protein